MARVLRSKRHASLATNDSRLVPVNWRATAFLCERKDFILINLSRKGNPIMSEKNSVVAILTLHDQAEDAVRELQKDGFDMKKLSIVGKDYHTDEHVVGYYNTGDRMMYWGKLGAFWGGFWGLLFGSAFFWVPGIGQVLVAGPLVTWIVAAPKAPSWWEVSAPSARDCTA